MIGTDSLTSTGYYQMFLAKLTPYAAGISAPSELQHFSIFPNPSSGNFTISYDNVNIHSILEVYDISGKIIFSDQISESGKDLTNIPSGIYLVKLTDGEKVCVKKMMVE